MKLSGPLRSVPPKPTSYRWKLLSAGSMTSTNSKVDVSAASLITPTSMVPELTPSLLSWNLTLRSFISSVN